jgi:hypothetical protein
VATLLLLLSGEVGGVEDSCLSELSTSSTIDACFCFLEVSSSEVFLLRFLLSDILILQEDESLVSKRN